MQTAHILLDLTTTRTIAADATGFPWRINYDDISRIRGHICRVNMVDGHVYFFYWELSAIIASKRDVPLDGHMSAPDLLHTREKNLASLFQIIRLTFINL